MEQEKAKTSPRTCVERVKQRLLTNRRFRAVATVFTDINTDEIQLALDFEKIRRKETKVDGRSKFVRTLKKHYGV